MSQLKALSIRQPFASLVAIDAKRVETRSRRTSHRGLVAIHASAKMSTDEAALCREAPFVDVLFDPRRDDHYLFGPHRGLPLGQVVAVAELLGVVPTEVIVAARLKHRRPCVRYGTGANEFVRVATHEYAFGNYAAGRYGWLLDNVQRLENPVEAKGQLGIWTCPPDVAQRVLAQLDAGEPDAVLEAARIDDSFDLFHPEVQR